MELSRSLLKDFAKMTTNSSDNSNADKYVRGTVKVVGDDKFVSIDGSEGLTPISKVIDVDDGDRVLVSVENHNAIVIGNFTFPPSARKEEEAISKADDAQNTANEANEAANAASKNAQDAKANAETALSNASAASTVAQEAKNTASEAMTAAENASASATEAKQVATSAGESASIAREEAAAAQSAVSNAKNEMDRINSEITNVKNEVSTGLADLEANNAAIVETLEKDYSKKTEVSQVEANLKTEISKSVGELKTTVEENYAAKNNVVDLEGRLQSQITQNAEGLKSSVSKIEKLESDTSNAQAQVTDALNKASAAQTAASDAQAKASAAQTAADSAKADAATAADKALAAQNTADQASAKADAADKAVQTAQSDLNEAKQNLLSVTNRVDATEQEIADAQAAVNAAQTAVNDALADAAEATLAATNAQSAADKAKADAAEAQTAATNAQLKADNAQAAATNAQAAADKAQADVAALTSRVTTAETNITQNSEKIELAASKVEEIGDRIINDYYTKTETDAKIKVSAEGITSSVKTQITESIDNIKIGGRNLIRRDTGLHSSERISNEGNTLVADENYYTLVSPIYFSEHPNCDEFTLSIWDNDNSEHSIILGFGVGPMDYNSEGYLELFDYLSYKGDSYRIKKSDYPNAYNFNISFPKNLLDYIKLEEGPIQTNWSPAPEEMATPSQIEEGINNISIGGRNLIILNTLDNEYRVQGNGELIADELYSTTDFIDFERDIGESKHLLTIWKESDESGLPIYIKAYTKDKTSYGRITSISNWTVGIPISNMYFDNENCYYFKISFPTYLAGYIKLERGTKATALTPAPEDMATGEEMDAVQDRVDANEDRISVSESTIQQLSDSISMLVTDENGESMMTQTSEGWTFNIGDINETLNSAKNDLNNLAGTVGEVDNAVNNLNSLVDDLAKKTAYIIMTTDDTGAPCIELGKEGNPFKVRITNTSVDFLDGTSKVAYITNKSLYIERAVIKDELQIGEGSGFVWKRRSNGNMGLRWVEVNE